MLPVALSVSSLLKQPTRLYNGTFRRRCEIVLSSHVAVTVFVNQKLKLILNCPTLETYKDLPAEQKLKVRDALYKNPSLIDEFVKANPEGFNAEELCTIQSWHKCMVGEFYIERYLVKHAILIRDDTVYAVLGFFFLWSHQFHGRRYRSTLR